MIESGVNRLKLLMQLSEMQHFTPNEQSIASYILRQRERMLHCNIQELAQVTYTSHSAINRLTRKLGMTGYKEFIITLAREFQQSTQNGSNPVDANYPFGVGESTLQVAAEIAVLMKETISKNAAILDEGLLTQTALLLNQADRVFIYALGDSQIRAKSFQNKLFKLNKYAIIATELSEWAHHTINVTSKDCALFLTYHGKSLSYIKAARHFKREGIPFVTITATPQSELAKWSTLCLQVANDEEKFAKIGTFSSQIALEYVLNVLFSCIYNMDYAKNKQTAKESLQKFAIGDMMNDI